MKKIHRPVLVILFVLFVLPASGAENQTSIAVYPIKAVREEDKATALVLTSLMINELAKSSKLIVLEEAMLKKVMETQGLNTSDACDDTTCQVEVGKLVKTQNILICDLSKLGSRWLLTIKVTSIQTRAVVFSDRQECPCTEDTLDQLVAAAALKIREHFGETGLPAPAPPPKASGSLEAGAYQRSAAAQKDRRPDNSPVAADLTVSAENSERLNKYAKFLDEFKVDPAAENSGISANGCYFNQTKGNNTFKTYVSSQINAPLDTVWEVLTDIDKYLEFQPDILAINVLDKKPDKLVLQQMEGSRTVTYDVYLDHAGRRMYKKETEALTGPLSLRAYKIEPGSEGKSKLVIVQDGRKYNDKECKAIKKRAESLAR